MSFAAFLFLLALIANIAATTFAAITLKGIIKPELISDLVFAPAARLSPYAAITLILPWAISAIAGAGKAVSYMELPIVMFFLVLVPSLLIALSISSWFLMINILARYKRIAMPGLVAFLPPSALALYLTLTATLRLIHYLPSSYVFVLSIFTILLTLNGCTRHVPS